LIKIRESNLPKGWTKKSLEKFWKSAGGKVSTCIEMMRGKVDNPERFCAALKDELVGTEWRGKEGKKKKC